jgi:hypothetical protein
MTSLQKLVHGRMKEFEKSREYLVDYLKKVFGPDAIESARVMDYDFRPGRPATPTEVTEFTLVPSRGGVAQSPLDVGSPTGEQLRFLKEVYIEVKFKGGSTVFFKSLTDGTLQTIF